MGHNNRPQNNKKKNKLKEMMELYSNNMIKI